MIGKHILLISSWIYFTHSVPIKFQQIAFVPATSFTSRFDQYSTNIADTGFHGEESTANQGFFNYEPDPFLITGIEAKQLAAYLYRRGLFFQDIPHTRSLIYNQNQRKKNGLIPIKLGSLRPNSPWTRF